MTDSSPDKRRDCESLLEISSDRPTVTRGRKDAIKSVYCLLKEPDLRKKCNEVGLGHKGVKHALGKRLNKLKLQYNQKVEEAAQHGAVDAGGEGGAGGAPLTCKFAGAGAATTGWQAAPSPPPQLDK